MTFKALGCLKVMIQNDYNSELHEWKAAMRN